MAPAAIHDASGTAQQKEASAENRALATMLRRSCAHTDSESITTTTDPDERTSGTHLLRMIDELHRTRMSTCLCQEERDRLKVLPKIRIAGFFRLSDMPTGVDRFNLSRRQRGELVRHKKRHAS